MIQMHPFFTIPFVVIVLVGCSNPDSTTTLEKQDPLYDLSTWDFGDNSQLEVTHEPPHTNEGQEVYAIAVATFTGPGHGSSANRVLMNLQMQYPNLASQLTVRERSRGSVLAFSSYEGFDDPRVKADIDTLRKIVDGQGQPLFGQVLLTKFRTPLSQRTLHPHDLWSIRKEYPTVVPIYTLEVAVWGDFEGGEFPKTKRRAAAELYASQLRDKGYEAFFYHNDDSDLSSVTVGLFNYLAVDAETGFYSPEVEAMISRFPERLVNGQQVLEYLDRKNHALGTRVQPPCLAEVPLD